MIRPENWKGHCLACDKDFTFKDGFACATRPGNHRLENVRFYHMGGRDIQHPREKRGWAPVLLFTRPRQRDPLSGNIIDAMPLEVRFNQGGVLDTDDAEVIFWMQTRSSAVGWGPEGLKTWEMIYLTTDHRAAIAQNRLDAINQQIKDSNTLLEQTQARVNKNKPAGAAA